MFVGFLYVISAMGLRYASQGEAFIPETYVSVGNAFKMLHLFMFLEILHPFFGYTKVSHGQPGVEVIITIFGEGFDIFLEFTWYDQFLS
jgi:hypothetical protein